VTDPIDIQKKFGGSGLDALFRQVKLYRYFGDGYGYYLVVTGRADVMIDAVMAPWDLIPLIPIIRGAGGIISGYSGQDPLDAGSSVAASRELHPEIIKILSSRPEDS
jgi:myo-inositol-1(or 4)-monophosphatase